MRKGIVFLFLISQTAFADEGLEKLRKSFEGFIQDVTPRLERTEKLKPLALKKGDPLSAAECAELKKKIATNYKINPFEFVYEGGSTRSSICGGLSGHSKNYLVNVSGKTNFDLPYTRAIQLEVEPAWGDRPYLISYLLSSDNRIVEIHNSDNLSGTGEMREYGVTSIDHAGNVYRLGWSKRVSLSGTDTEGEETIAQYIAADGATHFPLLRRSIKHPSDSSKDFQILAYYRAERRDWQDYQLPITFAWHGGFYQYDGKYFHRSRNSSSLSIRLRGGKGLCSVGHVESGGSWTSFPADAVARDACSNYWGEKEQD